MAKDSKQRTRADRDFRTQHQYDEEGGPRDEWARGYGGGPGYDQESGMASRSARSGMNYTSPSGQWEPDRGYGADSRYSRWERERQFDSSGEGQQGRYGQHGYFGRGNEGYYGTRERGTGASQGWPGGPVPRYREEGRPGWRGPSWDRAYREHSGYPGQRGMGGGWASRGGDDPAGWGTRGYACEPYGARPWGGDEDQAGDPGWGSPTGNRYGGGWTGEGERGEDYADYRPSEHPMRGWGREQLYRSDLYGRGGTAATGMRGSWSNAGPWDPEMERGSYDAPWGEPGGMGGAYSGKGPKGYQRSDDRICEDVCETLTRHGRVDPSDIEVEVHGGEVTLKGLAADRDQKRLAEDLAETVSGVREVHNQVRLNR